jgi:predicted RNase H-like nuclease (RuvC/YqgF family)
LELDRIQQKIRQLLQKKETMIEQLSEELQSLQARNLEREEKLEELRKINYI